MSINLELYKFFYLVAKYNSFSQASKELYISQPAITQKIHNLENILNEKLFYRTANGIELTKVGEKLYNEIKEPIIKLKNIELERKEVNKESICIGIDNTVFNINFLYQMLTRYYRISPDTDVIINKFELENGINHLFNENIDFFLTSNIKKIRRKNINIEKQIILHPCFYTSTEFYNKYEKDIDIFKENKFTYLFPKKGTIERKIFSKFVKNNNIYIKEIYDSENVEIQNILVKSDIGISFGFRENIIKELKENQLKEITIDNLLPEYTISVINNKNIKDFSKNIFWNNNEKIG